MNNNNKQQKLIAAAVMGMNLVNTLSPVAALAANPVKAVPQQPEQPKQEAKPLEYMSLPQVLQAVEVAIFAKAKGADYIVPDGQYSSVTDLYNGDTMTVESGGTGEVWMFDGGTQVVKNGGTGSATWLSFSGTQIINDGGKGYAHGLQETAMQIINSGGYGYARGISWNATQVINNGGTGTTEGIYGYGGMQIINNGGKSDESVVWGGTQIINEGAAAEKTTVKDGIQIIYGGDVTDTTVSGGTVYYENANANVSNVTMTGGTYTLNADGGTYKIDGDFNFTGGSFDMAKKITDPNSVDDLTTGFIQTHTYETVNINNLTGSGGNFIFNTNLATDTDGDKITIINAAPGINAYVQISDESKFNNTTVTGNHALLLIKDESGNATFTGKDLNEGGFFTLTPKVEKGTAIGKAENEWYLTHVTKKINNDTQVIIESMDNAYALWCNTKDSLRKRMGELHMLPVKPDSDGVWARYTGGEYEGEGYNGNYNFYQLGWDKNYDGKSIYGFALEKGGGNASYEFGSGENDLFAGSLYATWLGDDGSYTDVVAKVGRYDSEVNSYGDYPDHADYENNAYSLSVEYGKNIKLNEHGTYIEPQAQVIAGRLEGADYITDRGQKIHGSGINSFIGRVGFLIGERTPDGNDVYFKASALHEFDGAGSLSMLAANGETLSMDKDYSDTWFELGIGGNFKIGHNSYLYGDIERSFGGDMNKLWQVVAGLRFEF